MLTPPGALGPWGWARCTPAAGMIREPCPRPSPPRGQEALPTGGPCRAALGVAVEMGCRLGQAGSTGTPAGLTLGSPPGFPSRRKGSDFRAVASSLWFWLQDPLPTNLTGSHPRAGGCQPQAGGPPLAWPRPRPPGQALGHACCREEGWPPSVPVSSPGLRLSPNAWGSQKGQRSAGPPPSSAAPSLRCERSEHVGGQTNPLGRDTDSSQSPNGTPATPATGAACQDHGDWPGKRQR